MFPLRVLQQNFKQFQTPAWIHTGSILRYNKGGKSCFLSSGLNIVPITLQNRTEHQGSVYRDDQTNLGDRYGLISLA